MVVDSLAELALAGEVPWVLGLVVVEVLVVVIGVQLSVIVPQMPLTMSQGRLMDPFEGLYEVQPYP